MSALQVAKNEPPIFTAAKEKKPTPNKTALDCIDANIQTLNNPDPNFKYLIQKLIRTNDCDGAMAIYEACAAAYEALLGIFNKPRCEGEAAHYIEDMMMGDLWARAYAAADALKGMPVPERHENNYSRYIQTLFDCALRMGNNIEDAIAIANEIDGGSR